MYEGPVVYESQVTDYFLLGLLIFLVLLAALIILLALSKIFQKADKPGWKGFIPFYNLIALLEITHLPTFYFVLLIIPIVQLFPMVQISINLAKSFQKNMKFSIGLLLLPFVFYPILAFSKDKYIGINEEKVEEVVLHDLIKEQTTTNTPTTILKTDQNISVGTTNTAVASANQEGILQADMSILNQKKREPVEYIECPVCKNKVKSNAPVCFICGHKFQ